MWDVIPASAPRQGNLPNEYRQASPAELNLRICAAKHTLGKRLVMMGHFYQRDEVIQYADFVGDSFQLAQAAKSRPEAETIVFCGVHFMAETADMLSRPEQPVVLPNLAAGCSMADMADLDSVADCWEQLEELFGVLPDASGRVPVIPVTYMNSSAALKGFCGKHGGIVCTSSNAAEVLRWAFERGQRVLFFPDQHLGRNTGKAMGVPLERMPVWSPAQPLGGNNEQTLRDAQVHKIFCLDSVVCPCSTMYRIHPSYIAWVLEALERGEVLNRITVAEEIAIPARVALERMLSLKPGSAATTSAA